MGLACCTGILEIDLEVLSVLNCSITTGSEGGRNNTGADFVIKSVPEKDFSIDAIIFFCSGWRSLACKTNRSVCRFMSSSMSFPAPLVAVAGRD